MSIQHQTSLSLTRGDQLMREELETFGYTVIGTWRYGATKLLEEMRKTAPKKKKEPLTSTNDMV